MDSSLDLRPLNPYPRVRRAVADLLNASRQPLEATLVGVCFDGSIALGDFDPSRSDVDLVVVTRGPLSAQAASELASIHRRVARAQPEWGEEIEVVYISEAGLHPGAVDQGVSHFYVERGSGGALQSGPLDPGWLVHLRVISRFGIGIVGRSIRAMVSPVSDDALRQLARFRAERWLPTYCGDPASLSRPGERAYVILTACRMLYTLRTGSVVSKMEAARWTRRLVDNSLASVINTAMQWRKDDHEMAGTPEDAVRLLQFVRAQCAAQS